MLAPKFGLSGTFGRQQEDDVSTVLRLKPITIIALDPHTSAFCDYLRGHLERGFGERGRLIQMQALVSDGGGALKLEANLPSIADSRFDLQAARQGTKRIGADDAHSLFEKEAASLEPALIAMLGSGRRAAEIEAARREGIDIVKNRTIYLLLSSSDSFARGVLLDLAAQIRWLFAIRFTQELYTLDVVVMLPGLFEHAEPPDYAATYALLKKLDHSCTTGLMITAQRKMTAFDNCWLMDGTNGRGDEIGTLAEKIESYSDAFAGFLTAEPEMSGALTGTRTSRGKMPAYSAFGHGELFFPAAIAVKRLSSALARDITTHAFLDDSKDRADNSRKVLLAAKQFVLGADYNSALEGLERHNGALIWHDFNPRAELQHEGVAGEHVSELERHHLQFQRETLPEFQHALLTQNEVVHSELVALLDAEIDRRADAVRGGINEARGLVESLVEPGVALQADALGEPPQNFITELRGAEGTQDAKLGIVIDKTQSKTFLDQVNELRSRLSSLETTLRLTNAQPVGSATTKAEVGGTATEAGETASELDPLEEQQRLIAETEETKLQIQTSSVEYKRSLIQEDRIAYEQRREAMEKAREEKAQAIDVAEKEVVSLGDQLNESTRNFRELQEQRRKFLVLHFVIHPSLASLILVVPALAALFQIGPAVSLMGFFWENLFGFLVVFLVVASIYTAAVLYVFMIGINKQVNVARERIKALELSLKSAAIQLRRAHNDQLRLQYDLYAQGMRVDVRSRLIETARQRVEKLGETLVSLAESQAAYTVQHSEASPASSTMRRPILNAAEIDAYYGKVIQSIDREAETFVGEHLKRSQVWRLPIEEFRSKLETFTQQRFDRLTKLSIEDVLLREPKLLPAPEANLHLQELHDAAETLVQLRDMDTDDDIFGLRDVTIWAGTGEAERLLELCRVINPATTRRPSENELTLRALTRCLHFPAYSLGQIEYYRACYLRNSISDYEVLPDLIPDELDVNPEIRRAHEQLLLALATGLVEKKADGEYTLSNGKKHLLGSDRRQIAEKFANDYSSQKVYGELSAQLEERLADHKAVYQHLTDFANSATDLETFEHESLDVLAKKYHPLR
jgi:hypothetical protein